LAAELEKNDALNHRVRDLTDDNNCLNEHNTKLRDTNNV